MSIRAIDLQYRVRWGLARDLKEVLDIEYASFSHPWSEREFRKVLRARNIIIVVAQDLDRDTILGYAVYSIEPDSTDLLSIAVHPSYRRFGIGRALVERVAEKTIVHQRSALFTTVRETNLPAQLFLRDCDFQAVEYLRGFYLNLGVEEDGIRMLRNMGGNDE